MGLEMCPNAGEMWRKSTRVRRMCACGLRSRHYRALMRARWIGWLAGAALLLLATAPWFVSAANGGDDITFGGGALAWAYFGLVLVAAVLTGYFLHVWAIVLLILCVVVLVPLGENPQDSDNYPYWALQLTGWMLFLVPAVLAGMATRLLLIGAGEIRRRRRPASDG
jgi:hypothetical protein